MSRSDDQYGLSYAFMYKQVRDTNGRCEEAIALAHKSAMAEIERFGGDAVIGQLDDADATKIIACVIRAFAHRYIEHHSTAYHDLYDATSDDGEPVGEYTLGMLGAAAVFRLDVSGLYGDASP